MANRFASVRTSVGLTIYDILPKNGSAERRNAAFLINGCQSLELAACKALASTCGDFSLRIDMTSSASA